MAFPQFAVYSELDFSATGLSYQELADPILEEFITINQQWVADGKTLPYDQWSLNDFLISPTVIKRYWLDNTSAQDYFAVCKSLLASEGVEESQLVFTIFPNIQ